MQQENKNFPPVTVVISTCNRTKDLVIAIKSILQLDYPNFRLIVVDQSDDVLTRQAVQPFLNDRRFTYIPSEIKGVAAGRNLAISYADTEFIAITDDDCEVPPEWLKELVAAFEVDERIAIVFGEVIAGPHDSSLGFIPTYECHRPFLATNIWQKNQVRGITACAGVRRSIWEKVGKFDSHTGPGSYFKACADGDYTIKVLLNHYFVYQTPTFKTVHYGFRNWKQGRELAQRNWFGIGGSLTKYIKSGHWQLLSVAFYEIALILYCILNNLMKQQRISGVTPLLAFARGVLVGLRTAIDPNTLNFYLPDMDSDVAEQEIVKNLA